MAISQLDKDLMTALVAFNVDEKTVMEIFAELYSDEQRKEMLYYLIKNWEKGNLKLTKGEIVKTMNLIRKEI